jgi:hypothetical protein
VKHDKSTTEILEVLLEVFGEHSLSRTAVFEWHSCFKADWVSHEDDERSGQPSTRKMTENAEKIWELIHEGRRWTIHELAETIGIGYGVCQGILTEFENAPHCHEVCSLTLDKWSKAAARKHGSWATR